MSQNTTRRFIEDAIIQSAAGVNTLMIESVLIKAEEECDGCPIRSRTSVRARWSKEDPRERLASLRRTSPQTYELHAPYLAGYILRLVAVFIGPPRPLLMISLVF